MNRMKSKTCRTGYRIVCSSVLVFFLLFRFPIFCHARNPEILTYTGPIYNMGEIAEKLPEILEQSGKCYRLVSEELKIVEQDGILTYVSASVPYELEGQQQPPQTAIATLRDERGGVDYEREVSLIEIIETGSEWIADFSFPIMIRQYDSGTFFLEDVMIPSDTDLMEYKEEFLQYLGLSSDCYRIDRIEWDGDAYKQDGVVCRNAAAYGEKLIRYVEVKYGGQVRTPAIPGKRYEAVYEEIILEMESINDDKAEENDIEKEMESVELSKPEVELDSKIMEDAKEGIAERIRTWMREHVWVTVFSGVFFLCIAGWGALMFISVKKSKNRKAGD